MTPLLVALGGGLGAVARYQVAGWVLRHTAPGFPWGTLTVNLSGSFLLGLLLPAANPLMHPPSPGAALLGVGFLGAFTTFSTFSFDTLSLIRSGKGPRAALYVGMSLGLGLVTLALGIGVGSVVLPGP